MIKVKVCGMLDPLNIQEVISTGPDYLGFIFYKGSKRYVGKDPDKALFLDIPVGIKKVGVFVNETPENVLALAALYDLNPVQLHGNEPVGDCKVIAASGLSIIKAFGIGQAFDFDSLIPYQPVCDYFLFDSRTEEHGGTGLRFDWDALNEYRLHVPFFLSGGISYEDAGTIRSMHHPFLHAADINSRFELAPGIKDKEKIQSFIMEIKNVSL